MKLTEFINASFSKTIAPPGLSKMAIRRIEHTHVNPMTLRTRFDIGRFQDRSKYDGDGKRK